MSNVKKRISARPWEYTAFQLAKVGVQLEDRDTLQMMCEECGQSWRPMFRPGGKPYPGAWKCINGCNSTAMQPDSDVLVFQVG